MKIVVVGAGFAGLTASLELIKKGHEITLIEKENLPGGLSLGFRKTNWDWYLEKHYHHLFTSDNYIKELAKNLNIEIDFKRVKTRSLIGEKIYSLDSAGDVLGFNKLSFFERLRMGMAFALLKTSPFLNFMEKFSASSVLPKFMGKKAYNILWEPLLKAKFGSYKDAVPLSWFWARVKKRSAKLGYPRGGFQNLANAILKEIDKKGEVLMSTKVLEIKKENNRIYIQIEKDNNRKEVTVDKVIVTTSFSVFAKIVNGFPDYYSRRLSDFNTLSAINLVLSLNEKFFQSNTYWLNICNKEFPFLSVVEHTKFIKPKYYNNNHILYIGNYLQHNHPFLKMNKEDLLKVYTPYLKKLNKNFESAIIGVDFFNDFDAQPIITLNYSRKIVPFETPIKNLYIANMQQIYPWDRGTNYAVELGKRVAKFVEKN